MLAMWQMLLVFIGQALSSLANSCSHVVFLEFSCNFLQFFKEMSELFLGLHFNVAASGDAKRCSEDGTQTAHCSYRISRFYLSVAIVPRMGQAKLAVASNLFFL